MEFIGGLGVAMWGTGSAVLVADLSVGENRGRAVASRSASNRLGMIIGPFIGGAIAATFDLRAVFLFNGLTKLAVLAIVLFLVRETNPDVETGGRRRPLFDASLLSQFATRSFLIITLVSLTVSMMTQGVFSTLFPLFLREAGGLSAQQIGTLMTIAGISILATSLPNGYLVDRYGRKATLVPGLLVLAAAALLLPRADAFSAAAFIVVIYGVGTGMCQGAAQVYVMDLAPRDRRGAFLGMWALLDSSGGAVAPLTVGLAATQLGYGAAFLFVGTLLAVMALVMWVYGPDTFRPRAPTAQGAEPTTAR
jgi:MFS family permease